MTTSALLLLGLLAQAEPGPAQTLVVLPASNPGALPRAQALSWCAKVSTALAAKGFAVPLEPDAAVRKLGEKGGDLDSCRSPECFAALGRMLEVEVVVSAEFGEVQQRVAAVVEAHSSADAKTLAAHQFLLDAGAGGAAIAERLVPFVDALRLAAPPAQKPAVAPVTPEAVRPVPIAPALVVAPTAPVLAPPWVRYLTGAGAVAAGGTTVVFVAIGSGQRARLRALDDPNGFQARELQAGAAASFGLAAGAAALTVVLGVATASLSFDVPAAPR